MKSPVHNSYLHLHAVECSRLGRCRTQRHQNPVRLTATLLSFAAALFCVASITAQKREAAPHGIRVLARTSALASSEASKSKLTALVDGHPAEVEDIAPATGEPLIFAILLDVSGSMKDEQPFEKQSALELFRRLAAVRNVGYFGDFNDELYLERKPASLETAVKELKGIGDFRGGSALRYAVVEAAKLVNRSATGTNNRRIVFVFSDGEDNASKLSLKEAVANLQSEGVPVFCIGLLGGAKSRQKSVTELQTLSDSTGGVSILLSEPQEFLPALLPHVENQYWPP